MELNRHKKIGVVSLRQYNDKHDCRFEMESGRVGFSLFRTISCTEEELDPELVREWWFRFRFWAWVIDTIRFQWIAHLAKKFL